jgi:hypothetical protein
MSDSNGQGNYPIGAMILDDIMIFLGRFVAYPSEAAKIAHTLWIAHTHAMGSWESTPRIAFLSPEPGSGKTRALEITELLVPRAVEAVNVTPAYLFRKVGNPDDMPTILFDEIDTVFGPRAKENEEIRGLLNAGHRRGAVAGRAVSNGRGSVSTEEIQAYCPVAMGGLGGLPDTLLSRSVIIRMRRRLPNEVVEPFRRRVHAREGWEIRDKIEKWASSVSVEASKLWPTMPEGIADRDADIWEPLLTIADLAGGEWPKRARVTAVTLVTDSIGSTPSLGIRLLADLRTVFGDRDAMSVAEIITALIELYEAPWGDLKGRPLNPRGLAQRLRAYEIQSMTVRDRNLVYRGYKRDQLYDAWQRYLPPVVTDSEDIYASSETVDISTVEANGEGSGVLHLENVTSVTAVTEAQEMITDFLGGEVVDH